MLDKISAASPAMQVAAVVISYIIRMIDKIANLFTFATGVDAEIDD